LFKPFKFGKLPVASLDFGCHGNAGLIFHERQGLTRGKIQTLILMLML